MRYHFNIRDSQGLVPDDEGSDLTDIVAARAEAHASAADFAIEDLRAGRAIRSRDIEITDTKGSVLEILSVQSVAGVPGK